MENAVANARTGRLDSVLSTLWRGVVYLSHCNRLPYNFRRHKRFTATVQQEMTFNRELSAGDLIAITSRMLEIRENSPRDYHEMPRTETHATVAGRTLTEARLDCSTRKPCPLPPEIQRRSPRDHAGTAPRALEFALPGQW